MSQPKKLTIGLGLFLKYPEPGHVKTRLASESTDHFASEVYRKCVSDTLSLVKGYPNCHLFYDTTHPKSDYESWLKRSYDYIEQTTGNLGNRLYQAFRDLLSHYDAAIIMGTDSPDLPSSYLRMAYQSFINNDVIIGPAIDGGYYLIGFKRSQLSPYFFDDITWSTDQVFEQTLSKMKKQAINYKCLPKWSDIDTLSDYLAYQGTTNRIINRNKTRNVTP